MIRRDFIMREVQQLAQMLARCLFLRARQEYETALSEIGNALRQLESGKALDTMTPDDWLQLCRRQEADSAALMLAVSDVLREQAVLLETTGRPAEANRSRDIGIVLRLESILSGETPLTKDRLDETDNDIARLTMDGLSSAAMSRLFSYNVERCRWSTAEDILFEWAERGEPAAKEVGRAFYHHLAKLSPEELTGGGLSPDEVADGLQDLERL